MIQVNEGFTSIEVAADRVPYFNQNGYVTASREPTSERRKSTGARVTLEFFRSVPLPAHTDIRVRYDIAQNGGLRQILGVPQLTHTTASQDGGPAYHYRLSHWIPAAAVMHCVRA